MKELKLETQGPDVEAIAKNSQHGRIVITSGGKPLAVVVGIEHKDAEDLQLEQSKEFWQMIEERRRRPTVPFEQVKAELDAGELPSCRYSMVIHWSDDKQAYVATLPEFGGRQVFGESYEEAAIHGQDLLYTLMEERQAQGKPLPEPARMQQPVGV